ncbi:VOC family protein [Noviherbaspirillum saxi]|uniref:VOC family protein n=1 Tax=Noviherbaspirillum saxi TaxID=2320863 RepID=A0A3A3FWT3_9BURK|nr:VOC family protein [Noviherbaspirillum saxi]RJF98641.1 VOC family protein [Noviherbaspirillum saxi]
MSTLFGKICQIGYVVQDIEAAMQHWLSMGVGPWFHAENVNIDYFNYRGQASSALIGAAVANSGDMQIELIQMKNDGPSMWKEFVEAGGTGIQHIAYWTKDYQAVLDRARSLGHKVAQEGQIGGPTGRFCYFESASTPGTVIELSDISGPKGQIFEQVRLAALNWDGTNPIRKV